MLDAIVIAGGLLLWWLCYGTECALNGAVGGWSMPFREWWKELLWNLPIIGQRERLRHTGGNAVWAAKLPGRLHFMVICVLLPLLPWLLYRINVGF